MRTKRLNFVRFGVFLTIFPLCSFSSGAKSGSLSDYKSCTKYYSYDTHGKTWDGEKDEICLGKRGWGVDHFLKYEITSYKRYSFSNNTAFPLDYKSVFINPGSLKEYTLSMSTSYFTQYTYSYSETITREVSNAFAAKFKIPNMLEISDTMEVSQSSTQTKSYTFGFGRQTTLSDTFVFDLEKIPSGYVFSPTVVCEAEVVSFKFEVVSRWWWGDYFTNVKGEKSDNEILVVYDPSTIFLTMGIKSPYSGSDGPEYYLDVL